MLNTETNILKSSEVEVEGQFHLDVHPSAAQPRQQASSGLVRSQVRIVENHPEYALIELTCACGCKSNIRCQYEDIQPTTNETQQN